MKSNNVLIYFAKNITTIIGIVFVWRGIWYVMDEMDKILFGGSHILTALGGIIAGLLMLYLPDKQLQEIEKL